MGDDSIYPKISKERIADFESKLEGKNNQLLSNGLQNGIPNGSPNESPNGVKGLQKEKGQILRKWRTENAEKGDQPPVRIKNSKELAEMDFPLLRYVLTEGEIIERFKSLQSYEAQWKSGGPRDPKWTYITASSEFTRQWLSPKALSYVLMQHSDYGTYNCIGDFFQEHIRVTAKRSDAMYSVSKLGFLEFLRFEFTPRNRK
jgi:hypothetical protein